MSAALIPIDRLEGRIADAKPTYTPGEAVTEGRPLFTLHTDDAERIPRAMEPLEGGYEIGDAAAYTAEPLVIERVS